MSAPIKSKTTKTKTKRGMESLGEDFPTTAVTAQDEIRQLLRFVKAIKAKGENQATLLKAIKDPSCSLIIGAGMAGTGKSLVTLSGALQLLKDKESGFDTIMVSKSVQLLEHEDFGFLPGSVEDKLSQTHQSFFWHLNRLLGDDKLTQVLRDKKAIEMLPVGVLRGLSIPAGTVVILDEAQNLSVANIHTLLTRMEDGSKLICLGDIYQRDRSNQRDNGLLYLLNHIKGLDKAITTVEFTAADACRSRLTAVYQGAYENFLGVERPSVLRKLRGEPDLPREPFQVQITPQLLVETGGMIEGNAFTIAPEDVMNTVGVVSLTPEEIKLTTGKPL